MNDTGYSFEAAPDLQKCRRLTVADLRVLFVR
jgi:hypothetical protein